jgi:hypothetical protein
MIYSLPPDCMNNAQENKLAMYQTVLTVCDGDTAAWSGIAAFGTNLVAFRSLTETISALATAQTAGREGVTKAKVLATEGLLDQTMVVAGALGAYAVVAGKAELEGKVNFSRTELAKLRDDLIDDRAEEVLNLATSNLAELGAYGVVQAMLDALDARIEAYRTLVQAPRAARVSVKSLTEAIGDTFVQADRVLKGVLDRLALQFKEGAPAFHASYTNARIIVDLGGGRGAQQPETPEVPVA